MTEPLPEAEVVALLDASAVMIYAHTPPWNSDGQLRYYTGYVHSDTLRLAEFLQPPWPDVVNHYVEKIGRLMRSSS